MSALEKQELTRKVMIVIIANEYYEKHFCFHKKRIKNLSPPEYESSKNFVVFLQLQKIIFKIFFFA